jgi:hypothetical protein
MALFHWFQKNKKSAKTEPKLSAIALPRSDEGSTDIEVSNYDAFHRMGFDIDRIPSDEYDLIRKYREIAVHPLVEDAIDEITNEAIIIEDNMDIVKLNLDNVNLTDNVKKKILEEFNTILKMLNFKNKASGYFRKWYIDGRIYFQKIIKDKKELVGLVEIDPLTIKLIRQYTTDKTQDNVEVFNLNDIEEFYIFNRSGINNNVLSGLDSIPKIPKEAIASATSGVLLYDGKTLISHLFGAIKPLNHLNLLLSSLVVQRIVRAPEKRVYYIGTGGLPPGKDEQFVAKVANRFRNKLSYNPTTGEMNSKTKFQTIMEDIFLPRKNSQDGTQIDTLQGSSTLDQVEDIELIQKDFYRSLKIPLSRLQSESGFNFGKSSEILRDELRFHKFINKLRRNFSKLFDDLLYTQLILKKIITEEEWYEIVNDISYQWNVDSYYEEMKNTDIIVSRAEAFSQVKNSGVLGVYMTREQVHKEIFKRTNEEIEELNKKLAEEKTNYGTEEENQDYYD